MFSKSDGPAPAAAAAAAQLERRIEALQVEASHRTALSLDEKSMIAAGQSSSSSSAAAVSTATALMPNDILVPYPSSALDGNSRFVPEPFVRVHVELDVSAPFPLPRFHGSYRHNDGVGEAIPVMATNDLKLHAEVMGFEYQPLGGRLHIDEKVVEDLTEMIASRYVLTYKKAPRDIWMKHVTGYTRMDTDAATYVKQCLEGEECPWHRFQGVFGRTRNSILPLLDRKQHNIPQEWPASDSFFGVNKALSDYVIMVALQCWSHINRCWMESTTYPCITQHLLVLHDEDFRSDSLPSDEKWPAERKWANLSGAAILEAAKTLSLVQFVQLLHLCTGHTYFRDNQKATLKRTVSTFFHARRFVSMETHNVDHFYREAFKKAVPQIGVVTDQMIAQMVQKGGKKAHYVGPLPANVTFEYELRPLVPAVKTIATSILKISGDVIVNPPFFFTHLFFRPDKAAFGLDVASPQTAEKNRLDCLYWMLCRYMSLTNRNALEGPIRERFDIKRQGNKKKYLCSANEPDELRPFGPEMRYACFRKLSTMYYAHPDTIYPIQGTASTLNARSAASYDRDDQKKPKKPRQTKKAKAAAAAAAATAVDDDDDDDDDVDYGLIRPRNGIAGALDGEVPKRKKRKASDKENVDPTCGEEIESDDEDETPATKKRKVATPKVVAPLLDDGGRPMIYDPMFLTADKLDLAWRKKYDNCRLLPSRNECVQLLQPLASLSLFHQFLTLAQSNSFPESKIWWVLYNGGPSSRCSVKRFLLDACRRWNESVRQMKTAMETAVASCQLDSSNVDHQNMMKTVRKAFHRSNRCWTLETTITQASRDFDNLMLNPAWIFRLLERIQFTVTATGSPKPIQDVHVMNLVFMLKQSWLGNKPISQCLATHSALSKLVLSNMVQSGVMVDGKLTDIHYGLEIFQHMQDVVIQHIKTPIFMYAAYVTNPPIGPLLEETHTEWVSAATSRIKTGGHKQHSLANSDQQLRNSIHAKIKRSQFMNALQNIAVQDIKTPLKAASFLMYAAVLESVSGQKVAAANVLKSIRDKIPVAVNTMFGLAADISAATAATALVPFTAPANALVPVAASSSSAAAAAAAAVVYHPPPQPERKTYREFLRATIRARNLTIQSLNTVWERLLDSAEVDSKKPPAEIIADDMVTFTKTQELQALQVIDTFIRGQFGAPETGCKDPPSAAAYVLLPPKPTDSRHFAYEISVCFIEKMHLQYKETAVAVPTQDDFDFSLSVSH